MTPQQAKIAESLRFYLEQSFWKFEIDNKVKIQSFTVKMEAGAVKSVTVKIET